MALTKCKECGNQISNKAKICPSCGYKKKNISVELFKLGCALTLVVPIIIVVIIILAVVFNH